MRKNRNKQIKTVNTNGGRENKYSFAKRSLLPRNIKRTILDRVSQRGGLGEIEDRRRFHPDGRENSVRSYPGMSWRLKVKGIPLAKASSPRGYQYNFTEHSYQPLPWRLQFENPDQIVMCVRRKIRKRVMHALGLAGRKHIYTRGHGGTNVNQYSKVSC